MALAAFLLTVVLVLWRPGGIHEAVPALIGAFILFLAGLVDRLDVLRVMVVVWNSAMTIISTFIMASVLEGTGFFRWVGDRLIERADGSGHRLFHLVLGFAACLTLFLNNDGSILLGTPVVLALVRQLRLSRRAAGCYLLGACLIASAASPPIGVSNMANLEAMSLVGISLIEHLRVVLVPALLGLAACWALLHFVFSRDLPVNLAPVGHEPPPPPHPRHPHWPRRHHLPGPHRPLGAVHPPAPPHGPKHSRPPVPDPPHRSPGKHAQLDVGFMWFAVGVVILVRAGFFAASLAHVPTYVVAVTGACILLLGNLKRKVVDPRESLRQAPWAILGFAFGMDLVVFGMKNAGIIGFLSEWMGPAVGKGALTAGTLPATLVGAVSALLNNHPGLIIGSLTLLEIEGLARSAQHVAYAGVVLGSDLGALLTPVGTLASLIWFHILGQNRYKYSWREYFKVSLPVIPLSFILALCGLYGIAWLTGL